MMRSLAPFAAQAQASALAASNEHLYSTLGVLEFWILFSRVYECHYHRLTCRKCPEFTSVSALCGS